MEAITDLLTAFQAGTFTFFVGVEKVKLEVHTHAIAAQSKVLDRMMNGEMKESVDKIAYLPDVDPETFLRFAHFCYFANYKFPPKRPLEKTEKQTTAEELATSNTRVDKNYAIVTFEVLKVAEQLKFYCHSCQWEKDLVTGTKFFPFCCQICVAPTKIELGFGEVYHFCTRCGGRSKGGLGIICEACLLSLGVPLGDKKLETLHKNTLDALKKMSYDALLSTNRSMNRTVKACRKRLGKPEASDDFLEHAKVFVFADAYEVKALKGVALARLISDFSLFDESKDDIKKIVVLIKYVYEHTPDMPNSSKSHSRLFRQLVILFAAHHAKLLMASAGFQECLTNDDTMMLDFIKALTEV